MQEVAPTVVPASLELLPYHQAIRDLLKRTDPAVWNWFVGQRTSAQSLDEARFDLLKTTYRVEPHAQPELYDAARQVAAQLGITAPITIYQAQNPASTNASLAFVPGEVHLVLHGPLVQQLSPGELRAILAHELAHFQLWEQYGGELLVAADMLQALIADPHAQTAHFASWRLLRLYTEIFCDRAAIVVTGDVHDVVSALVKTQTGVADIDPQAYLRQADEILSRTDATADGVTHPESYIRALAVRLWSERQPDCDAVIRRMIEGQPGLDELDLLEQERIQEHTRRLLDLLFRHAWFQTDTALAHARLYFSDYQPPTAPVDAREAVRPFRVEPASLRDYYCFVLLDFVTADRELDDLPLAAALSVAEPLALKSRFMELLRQELKLRKVQLERVDEQKAAILTAADERAISGVE